MRKGEGGVRGLRDRGQSACRANTVGHSRSKMQHEISGCLKRIGSTRSVVFVMSLQSLWLSDAAELTPVFGFH